MSLGLGQAQVGPHEGNQRATGVGVQCTESAEGAPHCSYTALQEGARTSNEGARSTLHAFELFGGFSTPRVYSCLYVELISDIIMSELG